MKVFYEQFPNAESVFNEFDVPFDDRDGIEFVYACYDTPAYEGYAHVIFIRDGLLYEVNGSHCSCNGLNGCWVPEETSVVALLSRPNVSDDAKNNLRERYKKIMAFV